MQGPLQLSGQHNGQTPKNISLHVELFTRFLAGPRFDVSGCLPLALSTSSSQQCLAHVTNAFKPSPTAIVGDCVVLTVLLVTMTTAANPSAFPLGCRLQRVRCAHRCKACRSHSQEHDQYIHICRHVSLFTGALLLSSALSLTPHTPTAEARPRLGSDEQKVVELFSKNTSSVVNITNLSSRRDAFTTDMQEYPQGAGSGIVWDTQGHIVVCAARAFLETWRVCYKLCIAMNQVPSE